MAKMTSRKVTSLYDLMDAAYDTEPIKKVCESLGHVVIVNSNRRRGGAVEPMEPDRKHDTMSAPLGTRKRTIEG